MRTNQHRILIGLLVLLSACATQQAPTKSGQMGQRAQEQMELEWVEKNVLQKPAVRIVR